MDRDDRARPSQNGYVTYSSSRGTSSRTVPPPPPPPPSVVTRDRMEVDTYQQQQHAKSLRDEQWEERKNPRYSNHSANEYRGRHEYATESPPDRRATSFPPSQPRGVHRVPFPHGSDRYAPNPRYRKPEYYQEKRPHQRSERYLNQSRSEFDSRGYAATATDRRPLVSMERGRSRVRGRSQRRSRSPGARYGGDPAHRSHIVERRVGDQRMPHEYVQMKQSMPMLQNQRKRSRSRPRGESHRMSSSAGNVLRHRENSQHESMTYQSRQDVTAVSNSRPAVPPPPPPPPSNRELPATQEAPIEDNVAKIDIEHENKFAHQSQDEDVNMNLDPGEIGEPSSGRRGVLPRASGAAEKHAPSTHEVESTSASQQPPMKRARTEAADSVSRGSAVASDKVDSQLEGIGINENRAVNTTTESHSSSRQTQKGSTKAPELTQPQEDRTEIRANETISHPDSNAYPAARQSSFENSSELKQESIESIQSGRQRDSRTIHDEQQQERRVGHDERRSGSRVRHDEFQQDQPDIHDEQQRTSRGNQDEQQRTSRGIQDEQQRTSRGIQDEQQRTSRGIQDEQQRTSRGIQDEQQRGSRDMHDEQRQRERHQGNYDEPQWEKRDFYLTRQRGSHEGIQNDIRDRGHDERVNQRYQNPEQVSFEYATARDRENFSSAGHRPGEYRTNSIDDNATQHHRIPLDDEMGRWPAARDRYRDRVITSHHRSVGSRSQRRGDVPPRSRGEYVREAVAGDFPEPYSRDRGDVGSASQYSRSDGEYHRAPRGGYRDNDARYAPNTADMDYRTGHSMRERSWNGEEREQWRGKSTDSRRERLQQSSGLSEPRSHETVSYGRVDEPRRRGIPIPPPPPPPPPPPAADTVRSDRTGLESDYAASGVPSKEPRNHPQAASSRNTGSNEGNDSALAHEDSASPAPHRVRQNAQVYRERENVYPVQQPQQQQRPVYVNAERPRRYEPHTSRAMAQPSPGLPEQRHKPLNWEVPSFSSFVPDLSRCRGSDEERKLESAQQEVSFHSLHAYYLKLSSAPINVKVTFTKHQLNLMDSKLQVLRQSIEG